MALTHDRVSTVRPSVQNTVISQQAQFPVPSGEQDTKQVTAGYEGDVEILSKFQARQQRRDSGTLEIRVSAAHHGRSALF